jgi:hypothetical protein
MRIKLVVALCLLCLLAACGRATKPDANIDERDRQRRFDAFAKQTSAAVVRLNGMPMTIELQDAITKTGTNRIAIRAVLQDVTREDGQAVAHFSENGTGIDWLLSVSELNLPELKRLRDDLSEVAAVGKIRTIKSETGQPTVYGRCIAFIRLGDIPRP